MGNVFALMSATSVDCTEDGETVECHGWIDPDWSMRTLFESRNDANPLLNEDEDSEDLAERIADLVQGYDDNGDDTFYSVDSWQDPETGTYWTYAIHFKRKFFGPKGWTEVPYIPSF